MFNKSIYIAYKKSPPLQSWHVVGVLSYKEERNEYSFKYTRGALKDPDFRKFEGMEDLNREYIFRDLPPLFQNRILNSKRPEFPKLMQWLGLQQDASPLDILSLTGGIRITDNLQTFCEIKPDKNGRFEHTLFIHSVGQLQDPQLKRIDELQVGEKLYFCLDVQNEYDHSAVIVRTENPKNIVGYCPRYLAEAITAMLKTQHDSLTITVDAINRDAPLQYKLRCKITGTLPKDISFITEEFTAIN